MRSPDLPSAPKNPQDSSSGSLFLRSTIGGLFLWFKNGAVMSNADTSLLPD